MHTISFHTNHIDNHIMSNNKLRLNKQIRTHGKMFPYWQDASRGYYSLPPSKNSILWIFDFTLKMSWPTTRACDWNSNDAPITVSLPTNDTTPFVWFNYMKAYISQVLLCHHMPSRVQLKCTRLLYSHSKSSEEGVPSILAAHIPYNYIKASKQTHSVLERKCTLFPFHLVHVYTTFRYTSRKVFKTSN